MVGGSGERKGLRLVAQYADACNIFEMPIDAIARKLEVLREHCETRGRAYDDIERTTLGSLSLSHDGRDGTQTVEEAVERFAALAAIGIDHAIVNLPRAQDEASFELVPELTARLRADRARRPLTPAGAPDRHHTSWDRERQDRRRGLSTGGDRPLGRVPARRWPSPSLRSPRSPGPRTCGTARPLTLTKPSCSGQRAGDAS